MGIGASIGGALACASSIMVTVSGSGNTMAVTLSVCESARPVRQMRGADQKQKDRPAGRRCRPRRRAWVVNSGFQAPGQRYREGSDTFMVLLQTGVRVSGSAISSDMGAALGVTRGVVTVRAG